jgi:hypothetical protein
MLRIVKVVIFLCALVSFSIAWADTHTSATCNGSNDQTKVQTAITAASAGDTVLVPTGSCTFASPVTINKGITVQGAGIDVTTITGQGFTITNGTNDWRVTGFTINLNWSTSNHAIRVDSVAVTGVKRFRIDHNKIMNFPYSTGEPMLFYGYSYGVIDNNILVNLCGETVAYCADNDAAFNRAGIGGYENGTIFVEDNLIQATNAGVGGSKCGTAIAAWDNLVDGQAGERTVIRFNTITYESQIRISQPFGGHGFESS